MWGLPSSEFRHLHLGQPAFEAADRLAERPALRYVSILLQRGAKPG